MAPSASDDEQPQHDEPDEHDGPVETDLGRAELAASAGMQNSVAVAGAGALLMVPVAWAMAAVSRWWRHRRR